MGKRSPVEVDVTTKDERVTVHVGSRWQQGLEDLVRRRPREARKALLDIAAMVDVGVGSNVMIASPRVLRVIPFVVSLAEALAHAEATERVGFNVHDGEPSRPVYRVERHLNRFILASGTDAWSLPRQALIDAVRAAIDELMEDVEILPSGSLLVFTIKKLSRAESLLSASLRPRRPARGGTLSDGLSVQDSLFPAEGTPFLSGPAREHSFGEESASVQRRQPPSAVDHVRLLKLQEVWDSSHALRGGWSIAFTKNDELLMVGDDALELVDLYDGEWQRVQLGGPASGPIRRIQNSIVYGQSGRVFAFQFDRDWDRVQSLEGFETTDDVEAIAWTDRFGVLVLREDGVVVCADGSHLLDGIRTLHSAGGQSDLWVAVQKDRRTIFFPFEDGLAQQTLLSEILALEVCKEGIIVVMREEQTFQIQWLNWRGEEMWSRGLNVPGISTSTNVHIRVLCEPKRSSLSVGVMADGDWFSAVIHTRTLLSEFVAWGREDTNVRVDFARGLPIVSSGRAVRVYPRQGMNPLPTWESRQLIDVLASDAPIPFHVRANMIVLGSTRVAVRDLENGRELCSYQGAWTPVVKLFLGRDMSVTVVGRSGQHRLDIHHGVPTAMLSVLSNDQETAV